MSHFVVLGTPAPARIFGALLPSPGAQRDAPSKSISQPSEVQCLQRQVLLHLEDQWPKVIHQAPDVQRGSPRVPVLSLTTLGFFWDVFDIEFHQQ